MIEEKTEDMMPVPTREIRVVQAAYIEPSKLKLWRLDDYPETDFGYAGTGWITDHHIWAVLAIACQRFGYGKDYYGCMSFENSLDYFWLIRNYKGHFEYGINPTYSQDCKESWAEAIAYGCRCMDMFTPHCVDDEYSEPAEAQELQELMATKPQRPYQ